MILLGDKLKELRKGSALTQKQVAEKLGIAHNTLSQFENDLARPSYEVLVRLALLYDVTTDYLLGNKSYDQP
ncbi:MAG: helix-turn-helix transcriptional regulator [Clostridia bacterium]|nr:helix-turn-helix transcriptional regulator [Clostridia bacterium]